MIATDRGLHLRWMIRPDMPQVLAIEAASFEYVWTEEDFFRVLRLPNRTGMVAECRGCIAGFMVYELHRHHLELLNFAVHPDWRRQGVGRALIAKLATKLSPHRRRWMAANTREANTRAHLFFRQCGFQAAAVLPGHYEDSGEDAYRFVRWAEQATA